MREARGKSELRRIYDRVAERYDFQHAFFTARTDQRGREMLIDRTVSRGDTVLDCGAGTGTTGLLAARKVGADGRVVLLDMSEGMLRVAKEKVQREELSDRVAIIEGDMLNLPFEDNSFDVVLTTYSLCPIYDPVQGAMELYRVTRPGGRIGVAHSTSPLKPWVRWLSEKVEEIVWHFPSVSLGCRSVSVLPTLEQLGCRTVFKRQLGIPLWPFLVFVVEKPPTIS